MVRWFRGQGGGLEEVEFAAGAEVRALVAIHHAVETIESVAAIGEAGTGGIGLLAAEGAIHAVGSDLDLGAGEAAGPPFAVDQGIDEEAFLSLAGWRSAK